MAKWQNAPVYFTVAQVRFNPILNLDSYIPSIQEKMRKLDFPDYQRETLQQLVMSFGAGQEHGLQAPSFAPHARCTFGTLEGNTSFVLESSALALQTVEYDTFETFSDQLIKGLEVIHEVINLAFTERVGIRYLDAVIPKSNESVADYLTVEVQGISRKLSGELKHSFSETLTEPNGYKLLSRTILQDGSVGLPPEMMASRLKINPRFADFKGKHAILDTDAFADSREAFNIEKLKKTMNELHEEIRKSFYATVSPHALNVWK